MSDTKYLNEQECSYCLVQALIGTSWIPMGITSTKNATNDFDASSALSDELRVTGRITCIVPTESWSFITLDTRANPIKISPFTKGPKDMEFIERKFKELGVINKAISKS